MGKVLILGIDAMDSHLLDRFESRLPNLHRMRTENPGITLKSVCPPDTPSAWASAYTGLNPAQHGIVYFIDALDKVSILASMDLGSDPVRGRTFWDIAGKEGRRCCVLLPFLGFPTWEINGVMVGRSTNRYNKGPLVQSSLEGAQGDYDLNQLYPVFSVPQKKHYPSYIEAYRRLLAAEMEFGLKMFRKEPWDVFFLYSSALDWLGHNLWSFLDEQDPTYPGENAFGAAFEEFYRLYDDMVGRFLDEAGPDTTVIVFSDHGTGRRPTRLFNINELLRREGLLVPKKDWKGVSPSHMWDRVRGQVVNLVNRIGIGTLAIRFVHRMPAVRRRLSVPQAIDWGSSTAYITDLSGIKAYSYGGIIIVKDMLNGRDYEELRTHLIDEMGRTMTHDGEPVVQWVCRREDLYLGEHLTKYPDLVFQLREDYGAGWAIHGPVIAEGSIRNMQPGTHKPDSAVLLVSDGGRREVVKRDLSLMDIAPTVLGVLGITPPFQMDGESFLKID